MTWTPEITAILSLIINECAIGLRMFSASAISGHGVILSSQTPYLSKHIQRPTSLTAPQQYQSSPATHY